MSSEASESLVLSQPGPAPPVDSVVRTPSTVTATSPRMELPAPVPRHHRRESTSSRHSQEEEDPIRPEPVRLDPAQHLEWRPYTAEPKIPPYQRGEDIENYLRRFKHIAKTWKWPETEWACRLVPLLSDKALEAYTAMDEDEAHCYKDLKVALLEKFDISPEMYRQQFRATSVPPNESPTETYHRLKGLYRCWVQLSQLSKEQIRELIVLEQLLCVFPVDVRTWVKEHELEDGLTAAKLALRNTQRGGVVCFYCQQPGHKASVCPVCRDKLTGACYAPRGEGGKD